MQASDIIIFKDKKLSDLFQQIYNNQHEKNEQLNDTIQQLQSMVKTVDQALMIVPTIAQCLSVSMKNDEMLVKLTTVVTKLLETSIKQKFLSQAGSNGSSLITQAEFEQIINNVGKQAQQLLEQSNNINIGGNNINVHT